jgi:5-(hydroxymethyl)furfural/furfural oxidase
VNVQNKTSWNALGQRIGNIAPTLLKPASRGQVSLVSADPLVHPRVEFNFLAEDVDLQRLMQAFAFSVEIVCSAQVRPLVRRAFPVHYTDRIRRLNERSVANALKGSLIALLLDAVPGSNDLVFSKLSDRHVELEALVADPLRLADHIRENVSGVFHPAGTCRMGGPEDRGAVVDAHGGVLGIAGLRVADASIMPTVVSGNTNIPTIMIAEKIAASLQNDP